MKAYKLTDENHCTRGDTKWGENISHTATGIGKDLCTSGWIHFYTDPHLAVFMNPAHVDFKNPVLWECETSGEHLHEALKSGCKTLTTIKQIPISEVTMNQRIAFAILCAMEVYKEPNWTVWAKNWLSGEDRTRKSALVSRAAATEAVYSAAAEAASYAAESAEAAAEAAAEADATYSAAYTAIAANVANTVDWSATINFIEIINEALKIE